MKHFKSMFDKFKRYRENNVLSDITIVVQKRKFKLHKMILAASSDYFETLFTTDMKEKIQTEIEIKGVTITAFRDCVDFIYSGDLDVRSDGVPNLLHAACLFQLWEVKDKCAEQIQAYIDETNCVRLYQLSKKYDSPKIEIRAREVNTENAEKLLTDSKVLADMDVDTLQMMLTSEDLNISDESVAFQGLVQWVESDKHSREESFCELLQFVRLPVVNRRFFTTNVNEHKHLQDCYNCKRYLKQTVQHFIDGVNHGLESYQLVVRLNDNNTDVMVLNRASTTLHQFNTETNALQDMSAKITPIPVQTTSDALAYHNNRLYIFGEHKGRRSFYCDFRKGNTWHEIPLLPNDHNDEDYRSKIVCFHGKILVVGGYLEKTGIKTVDCFDAKTTTWREFPDLNEGRSNCTLVVTDQSVYAIGGWNQSTLAYVEMYDNRTKDWRNMPNLNTAREGAAGTYYKQKIFVAGGKENLASVETYFEGDSFWTLISGGLNLVRSFATMFTFNKKMFTFGGERGNGTGLYEQWNENTEKWDNMAAIRNDAIKGCKVLLCHKPI